METDIKIESLSLETNEIEEISVKQMFEDFEKEWLERSKSFLSKAQYNEKMAAGDQFDSFVDGEVADDPFWDEHSRSSRNYLANLFLTWSSRILEDRPSVACYPNEPGGDIKKAEACNKILEYCKQSQDFDNLCFKAAQLVQPHSAVGFKPVWDPLGGPKGKGYQVYDENGLPVFGENGKPIMESVGKPLGDVRWDVVSIFDYFTDGAEEIEDSEYVCFMDLISKAKARTLLNAYEMDEVEISVEDKMNVWGVKASGVPLRELWIKPGSYQLPDGLFAVMVGDKVLFSTSFPYDHGELPLGVWKCGPKRSSEYGMTHVDNAVYIQNVINHNVAALDSQAKTIKNIYLMGHTSIIDRIKDGNKMIPVDDPQMSQGVRYLEPPDRVKVLVSSLSDNERALFAIFGLNEMLTGAENLKSGTAAKSIAYLNKLDSMKMAGASRSLAKVILKIMRHTLKLYQQFVKVERIVQVLGKGNTYEALAFKGADIAGVDVRLEPISGLTQFRASVSEEAQTQMEQTGPTPEGMSQKQTGLRQTTYDKSQRDIISAQIDAVIKGLPQEVDQTLDPAIAVDEILGVVTDYYGTPIGQNLMAMLKSYRDLAQQQQQAQMQQQPQQGQPQ